MTRAIPQTQKQVPAFSPARLARLALYSLGALLFLFLVGIIIYPSLTLVWNSVLFDDRLSLQNFINLIDERTWTVLRNSLFVSTIGTIGATTLGVLLAWLVARTNILFKGFWQTLLIVPYLIPPFIGAIAWVYLLSPVGYINRFWRETFGGPLFIIYGEWGVIFVMMIYLYPIAYLINLGPLRQMNPVLEEAARISGAGTWRTLRDVTLPLLLPNIWASALLIFMSMMANFGIPAVIGFPRRYFVLTNEIYVTVLDFASPNNLQSAAALSMLLVVIALLVLVLQRFVRRGRSYAILTGKNEQPRVIDLGPLRYGATGLIAVIVVIAVVAPLLAIFATSITPAPGVILTPETATVEHYVELFGIAKVRSATVNSLLLAGGAATTIIFMSVIIAYLTTRLRIRGRETINALVLLPYAVPGTIVALAMILAFLRPLPLLDLSLYNTIWILYVAYVARFLTFGVQAVSAGFEGVHTSLEEAARISGADPVVTFKDIVMPLIRSNMFAGWFLVFMPALTELTLSALLFSVGNETLGQVVFGLNQEGQLNLTAALAFVVTAGVLLLNILISRLTRSRVTTI